MTTFFSETGAYHIGYITIGDEYDKKPPKEVRDPPYPTMQILTCPVKKGRGPEVVFDWLLRNKKYLSISEGEKYTDPGYQEKKARIDRIEKQKQVHGNPFRYISPSKKSSGLGNYYGCFSEYKGVGCEPECKGFRHETEYDVIKKGELPERREPKAPNVKTCPTKRGTYGMPGLLLSDRGLPGSDVQPWTGAEYICDPYDREHEAYKAMMAKSAEQLTAVGHPAPWKSQCRIKGRTFDHAGATGASQVYRLTRPLAPKKLVPPDDRKNVSDVPFKPPGQGKTGLAGFFGSYAQDSSLTRFPEYREDPYEIKEQKEKTERTKNKPAFGAWVPVSYTKSLCTSSIEFRGF
eukprot:TRINITY_DN17591_c0_g2_i1.p1 TRINITY_DN17591_c0_g2~~TRINITY_DN17591_c0_g2_i1.p1  ORF type:complete len:374 (+),score=102.08 TRINITY_DN17591_c0_g2_i1:79-1122(+)